MDPSSGLILPEAEWKEEERGGMVGRERLSLHCWSLHCIGSSKVCWSLHCSSQHLKKRPWLFGLVLLVQLF